MRIQASGGKTYILLSGLTLSKSIRLDEHLELQPADCSHLDLRSALAACSSPDDIPVVTAFIPRTEAQLEISAPTPKEVASKAWNSSWDVMLLGAIWGAEIGFNLQSDVPSRAISSETKLRATNYHMRGLSNAGPYKITENDEKWIQVHFQNARALLNNDVFQSSLHCLASYRWHSLPRVQLAVLWAGIEGLFGATTEIRFRISLYISRYLFPKDESQRKSLFDKVKKLYDLRSAAVHGSKMKGDTNKAVNDSAELLRQLLRKCVEFKAMPDEQSLAP